MCIRDSSKGEAKPKLSRRNPSQLSRSLSPLARESTLADPLQPPTNVFIDWPVVWSLCDPAFSSILLCGVLLLDVVTDAYLNFVETAQHAPAMAVQQAAEPPRDIRDAHASGTQSETTLEGLLPLSAREEEPGDRSGT